MTIPKGKHLKDKAQGLLQHQPNGMAQWYLLKNSIRISLPQTYLLSTASGLNSDHATAVAQDISHIILPLFDARVEVLHASINSEMAQITTNAQKITDLETRMTTCEKNVADLDTLLSQRQNVDIIINW